MPAYKDKNGKWFVKFQYKENGKPKTKFKRGFIKRRDAQDYERKFLEYQAPSVDMSFETLVSKYLEAKERELRPNTLRGYQLIGEVKYFDAIREKKISEITPVDILDARSSMTDLKGSSVNLYISRVRALFAFAIDMYGLKRNPCSGIGSVKSDPAEKKFLTIDDIERLKALPNVTEETKMLIDILFWTGMRISEALALTVGDIHETYITINKHKVRGKGGYTIQQGTKNNHGRKIAIFESLSKELKDYIGRMYEPDPGTELFPRHYVTYDHRIARLFRLAGIDATVHSFRHSHVALLIHRGYSPKLIADRIGDTVETMLNVYAHVYPEDVSDMINDLENVSNMYHNA